MVLFYLKIFFGFFLQVPDFWNVVLFCGAMVGSYLSFSFWVSALLSCG